MKSSLFGRLRASITLLAYCAGAIPPVYAQEEPSAQKAEDAVRLESTGLTSSGARADAVAVGTPNRQDEPVDARPNPSVGSGKDSATNDDEVPSQAAEKGDSPQTLALPSGGDKSGVTGQAISIPKGSGSIQGMGESFSAQLSTGIATFSVPFALMKARGGVQPSLGLSYSSGGGTGPVGQGWSVGVPFIARQSDRGLPKYDDRSAWHPEQDKFVFNGGQELVPICTVSSALGCSGVTDNLAIPEGQHEVMPSWSANHQYFRPRVEGSFLRFFWSPDHRTWIVQHKSGTTMELGTPRDNAADVNALDRNPTRPNEIYRWHLSRQYDQHEGSGAKPVNVVLYKYVSAGGQAYLTDIFDTPPATNPTTAPLSDYAHHTRLVWETKPDSTFSFRSGWRIDDAQRLIRVDVASKRYLTGTAGPRRQVRKYHLTYASEFHKSILSSVQVEGRCGGSEDDASVPQENGNGALGPTSCDRLPPMTFGYSRTKGYAPNGTEASGQLAGYLPFDGRASTLVGSPNHSLDEDLSDFFDINSDGLPDVLVTAPGIYGNGHAVFFNADGGARGFGGATNMGVLGVLGADANTIKFSNLNLGVLDFDGDGRINLLHAPQVKKYSAYDPRFLTGNEEGAHGRMGWHWVGRVIETASGQNQKIDFGKDTRDTQVLDVDFDGLVDVVVSTGTEYQTYFSLGRLPGGDGQFGDGESTGATTSSLRNSPKTACVPHSALPVRFGDADTKLGDMNGDGITDIVRVRRGNVIYWPGRGNGTWGTGERDDCAAGTFGTNRHLSMTGAPFYSDVEGSTLRLSDVDGDGLDDLVQINYDSVDIYLNVDGKGWTSRYILDGTPYHAGYHNRVRLADVNGSGTLDVVWGDARAYKYVDLQGGQKPFLLTEVQNGLGKSTTLEYSTSTELMRVAEPQAACGVGSDPWATKWCSKMPTVAHVVKRVSEHDNITIRGRPPATYVTEYEYRDPVFEGRQREFRGFARARARRLGDVNSPTDVSESVFLLGECLDPNNGSAWDGVDVGHYCAPPDRWRDNLQEALKGLPVETHRYDVKGVHLSSTENIYTIRTLYAGLDGRAVRYAFLSQADTLLYDTARNHAARVGIARSGWIDEAASPAAGPQAAAPTVYAAGMAHLRSRSEVDNYGNQTTSRNLGCVGGDACPTHDAASYEATDETITQVTVPQRVTEHSGGWLWRTQTSYVVGSRDTTERKKATTSYDNLGRPVLVTGILNGSGGLRREASSPPSHVAGDGPIQQGGTAYDEFGNAVRSRAPNGRCADVTYDEEYKLFASTETVAISESVVSGALPAMRVSCASSGALVSSASYDHGLGVVTEATDLNDRMTLAVYDGMGRITRLHKPSATKPSGSSEPTYSTQPSVRISYRLPACSGCAGDSLPLGTKHSLIFTETQDGEDEDDTANYLESYAYVDGFGRTLATLSEADPDPAQDGADWVVGSLLEWDQKSAVSKKYIEFFWNGSGDDFNYEAFATTAYGRQRYDAFGRQVQTFDLDGTITLQSRYHALSTDLWDAADLSPGPHQHSHASERKDGHGRTIETTERFRRNGVMEERHVKTLYQSTGEPLVLARVRGADVVMRWMRYDTWGRMVLNVDAHTSTGFTTNYLVADTSGIEAWRYVYNAAGDLVGTSDARGCGQNFFYDGAGRVLGEDYAPCEDHHAAYTAASSGSDTENLEVAYFYDSSANVPSGLVPNGWTGGSFTKGRAIAVFDRASASFIKFDGRGRTTETQTRVAVPRALDSAGVPATLALNARYAPRVYSRSIAYDAADREVVKSTGTAELRSGGAPKVPDLLSSSAGGATPSSNITTSYSRRGTVKASGSSYGTLITGIKRTADGLVTEVVYGDAAETRTAYLYDERRRIASVQTYRGPPSSWPSLPITTEETQQLVLQDEDFIYDVVGNPVEIRDWRDPQDWPAGAKPVTKKIQYDDLYRATRVDYVYSEGDDTWTSPFASENDAVENGNGNALDDRVALPTPHVAFDKRTLRQTFEYDWLGNNEKTTDDANGFYDRSLGETEADDASKPYQLTGAEIPTTPGGKGGRLETRYDAAGGMTRLNVFREGDCLPQGAECDMRFAYEWDEVGRLVRARRWDTGVGEDISTVPSTSPAADLRYVYDAGDQRVLKEAVDAEDEKSYTLYVFDSLELRRTTYASGNGEGVDVTDYKASELTVVPYLLANGVRLARLAYADNDSLPESPSNGGLGNVNASESKLHVFFELGDHLGSTSVVLDKATGELVERSSFQAYGGAESDYRPDRWKNFREDYKFTGKEEDVEVGLQYFGKRYLNPLLGRWISTDPLTVHAPGQADLNVYAYVKGAVLKNIDPTGLDDEAANGASVSDWNSAATDAFLQDTEAKVANDSTVADVVPNPGDSIQFLREVKAHWDAGRGETQRVEQARADLVDGLNRMLGDRKTTQSFAFEANNMSSAEGGENWGANSHKCNAVPARTAESAGFSVSTPIYGSVRSPQAGDWAQGRIPAGWKRVGRLDEGTTVEPGDVIARYGPGDGYSGHVEQADTASTTIGAHREGLGRAPLEEQKGKGAVVIRLMRDLRPDPLHAIREAAEKQQSTTPASSEGP